MNLLLYEYAVLRVVPRPERGEAINVGVVLYCPEAGFLELRFHLDGARLSALDAGVDLRAVLAHLESAARVCAGGEEAGALGALPARERFGRVVAAKSTVLQSSPVHTGLTREPAATLKELLRKMVLPPGGASGKEPPLRGPAR